MASSPLLPANNPGNTCTSSCLSGKRQYCTEVCGGAISKRKLEADLIDRQINCPLGSVCIQPACEGSFCSLDGCADAPACQKATSKRSPDATSASRQSECPPGIECGTGPIHVCASSGCDLPMWANANLCQGAQVSKRLAGSEISRPICDLCQVVDGVTIDCCGTIVSGGIKHTESESVCPLYCITTKDGETLCGCAARDYMISLQGDEPTN